MSRRWFEIALPVPAGLVDEAAALLDFAGFEGVEVREHGETAEVVVVVEVDAERGTEEVEARAAEARQAVAVLGDARARVTELDPKVWTENWKKHFARRTFAGRIEVRPPWEQPSPETNGLVSIVINPGMAFGTGLHETTAGCLELLVDQVRAGIRVADVGCGSGILAVAAARLGAAEVLATDVDPLAVEATLENVSANGVADIVEVELEPGEVGVPEWEDNRPGLALARHDDKQDRSRPASPQSSTPNGATSGGFAARAPGTFDLLVANILAETLVDMHAALTQAVSPGGTLVLSGIEARRLKTVEEAFIRPPWRLVRTLAKGDWVSMALRNEVLAEPTRSVRKVSSPSVSGARS